MAGFCPHCGKPVTDDITLVCSACGANLSAQSLSGTAQLTTSFNRQDIMGRAIPFFTTKSYAVQTQTDYVIAFQSQDRDVNWIIFLVFCCLGLVPAIVYYYWFTHQHQVTVSMSGETEVKVTAIGNTEKAIRDAADFIQSIQ